MVDEVSAVDVTRQPPPVRARMTLRVSRDSGRSWGPLQVVEATELPSDSDRSLRFPPCACARHRKEARRSHPTDLTTSAQYQDMEAQR